MRSPAFRKAIIWNRSVSVAARKLTSSKTVGSGQNRTVVPVRNAPSGPVGDSPMTSSRSTSSPPSAKTMRWRSPSRSISTSTLEESALTTEIPTP
jgi:hypothetical protein